MKPAGNRESDEARQIQAQSTTDLLCLGNQVRTARQNSQTAVESRKLRLERIRKAVTDGTYKVDSAALSKAILRRNQP